MNILIKMEFTLRRDSLIILGENCISIYLLIADDRFDKHKTYY